jgi:hypothetical protein
MVVLAVVLGLLLLACIYIRFFYNPFHKMVIDNIRPYRRQVRQVASSDEPICYHTIMDCESCGASYKCKRIFGAGYIRTKNDNP